ncbi:hypothetical protein I6G66_25365 [Delftia acidovorans]|uniref:NADH:flavin oxidoreductase/NADH oxidase N-terminal domain-containing protein n=2 Tax=Delftia acidovorans TaxID=80866 RepID=A0A7T2S2D6_DELAC|nr:hypothetical protein I6G66_25365 [Delftia acidovorans]
MARPADMDAAVLFESLRLGSITVPNRLVVAVRRAVGADFVLGVRISQGKVNDFGHKWAGGAQQAAELFATLGAQPIDYLHTTEFMAWKPAFDDTGPSLAALARAQLAQRAVPVLANGSLQEPAQAAGMLARGEADFVSLGRGALTHADWPLRVRAGLPLAAFDPGMLAPIADLEHAARHAARTDAVC